MRQILLCTHGQFANGIKDSLELISGKAENVETVCVSMNDSIEVIKSNIQAFVDKFEQETDKVILTDIIGGSTTQASFHIMAANKNVYVVSGLNLGILLEIVLSAEENTEVLLNGAIEAGKATMQLLNSALKQ